MANLLSLWFNVLFLLLILRDKCEGGVSVNITENKTTGYTSTTHVVSSTPSSNPGNTVPTNSTSYPNVSSMTHGVDGHNHAKTLQPTTVGILNSLSPDTTTASVAEALCRSYTITVSVSSSCNVSQVSSSNVSQVICHSVSSSSTVTTPKASHTVDFKRPHGDSDADSEPKTNLYVWELVAIGCGSFVFVLLIIIGLLCYQNRVLRKKLKTSRCYSLPIKDNGAWIDSQDIPLWQKRASAFVSENPAAEGAPTLTT